ncbi:MAG: hypothetical protein OXI76_12750, partial [Gemmatimonadota bacterium]|nr:hypothetical protein [Gemmatimonadota bacterium]
TMDRASFGRIGAEGQDFLRLSIANGMDDIRRGVARIGESAEDAAGFAGFIAEEAARGDEGLFAPATPR